MSSTIIRLRLTGKEHNADVFRKAVSIPHRFLYDFGGVFPFFACFLSAVRAEGRTVILCRQVDPLLIMTLPQTYSAPFSASTMSIFRLFRATSRPTARETPKVSSTLTQ